MGMGENLAKGIILPSAAQSGGEGSKWKGENVTLFTWGQMENGQEGSYIHIVRSPAFLMGPGN